MLRHGFASVTRLRGAGLKKHRQVAALPCRRTAEGHLEVCLVTSRETGRWVIPKGWPMAGKTNWEAAATEAYEEAGLRGKMESSPLGSYPYWKRKSDHFVLIETVVYLMRVDKQMRKWPERSERTRRWMTLAEATEEVVEPGLMALLFQLAANEASVAPDGTEATAANP